MGKYKEIVHKLPEEKHVMEELTEITDEFIESVKITQPQKYANFITKLKDLCEKGHFTKEDLESIKDDLHFSIEDTTDYAEETYEVDFDKECFNKYDFNFIMNHMYKIYNPIFQEDKSKYAELTLSWLDFYSGKAYEYYEKVHK